MIETKVYQSGNKSILRSSHSTLRRNVRKWNRSTLTPTWACPYHNVESRLITVWSRSGRTKARGKRSAESSEPGEDYNRKILITMVDPVGSANVQL